MSDVTDFQLALCNRSLQMIGAQPLVNFEENSNEAIWIRDNYLTYRNMVLAERAWRFCMERQVVDATGTDAWGDHVFPVDYENTVSMVWHAWPKPGRGEVQWERVGDTLVSSQATRLYLEVCIEVEELRYPPLFLMAFEACLAAHAALGIARSTKLYNELMGLYQLRLQNASAVNAREAASIDLDAKRLTDARASKGWGI